MPRNNPNLFDLTSNLYLFYIIFIFYIHKPYKILVFKSFIGYNIFIRYKLEINFIEVMYNDKFKRQNSSYRHRR